MKINLVKEITFFSIILALAFTIFHLGFGLTNIRSESTININVHDTYFIIEKIELLPLFVLGLLYIGYFIKISLQKFRKKQTLLIFSMISLVLLLFYPSFLATLKTLSTESGTVIYPPLSGQAVEIKENIFTDYYSQFYYLYIALIFFSILTFYKLGRMSSQHSSINV
jgi:hypothetical protein